MTEIIEAVLRRDRWIAAAGIALLVLMAWAWLLAGAGMGMSAVDMTRMVYGDHSAMMGSAMADPSWDVAYWLLMFSMWWVMMVAMMLPSAAPMILLAAAVNRKANPGASPFGNTNRFMLGYLLAWGGFSLLATASQWALERVGLLSSMTMNTTNRWLGGGLLLAAAAWQFTPLKQVCLRHCRSPIQFLVTRRNNGPLLMGIEHGGWCLGCCWFLMALLFVGGVMNLFWIAGLSVFVLLEKLLPQGRGMGHLLGAVLAAAGLLLLAGCGSESPPAPAPMAGRDVHADLAAHSAEFERKIYRVTDRVYQAVGFGLANSMLVEGEECVFIVDTLGNVETAQQVKAGFEKITTKPIRALIYTHNHADHVFGALGFAPDGAVDVYAHATTEYYIDRVVNIVRPAITARSARMFGTYLPASGPDAVVNDGIGPFLEINGVEANTLGLIRPTKTFDREIDLSLCGVRVKLVHAPGETPDQIFVWLPDERVLMPGDNVYKAFPNLYTIRGTPYRDVLHWVQSIDRMRALAPEHLVPSHTRYVSGAAPIAEILTAYRDAIQFVHDQTIRGLNHGMTPDELVESVVLPRHLAEHPYLREFYGTVEWSVRAIYAGYLGWFDGDTATLSPVAPQERALGFVELAGGTDSLLAATRNALEQDRFAWAAELASELIRAAPDLAEPKRLKARALRALGQQSLSPNARNYYLTQARELEGDIHVESDRAFDAGVRALIASIPIRNFMAAMPTRLDPARSLDADLAVGFHFTDVDESYTIHVRRGVAEFQPRFPAKPDLSVTTDSLVWREIVTGQRNAAAAFASGAIDVEGGKIALIRFLSMFST